MRSRRLIPVLLLVLWAVFPSAQPGAQTDEPFQLISGAHFWPGLEAGYFWLSGEMLIPSGGRPGSGTRVSTSGMLGVAQSEATCGSLRMEILDRHAIAFEYLMMTPTGARRVDETFRFHNRTYLEGTLVETSLDFNWLRMAYAYRIPAMGGWTIAPVVAVHHIRHGITLNAETEEFGMASNTRRLDGTYPVLGLETRYLFPYGLDASLEMEGIHLITRGFLSLVRCAVGWQIHPDIMFTLALSHRSVHFLENNQPLNNEWFYSMTGVESGVAFSF